MSDRKKLTSEEDRGGVLPPLSVLLSVFLSVFLSTFIMAYRPPTTNTTNNNESGWTYVAKKTNSKTQAPAPQSRWGQSALRKPSPPPKTFEQEFPSLGKAPATPTPKAPVLSFADRMKQKLKEEEEEKQRKEAEMSLKKKDEPDLRVVGLHHVTKSFYTSRLDLEEEDEEGLDHDVYGRYESTYGPGDYEEAYGDAYEETEGYEEDEI